jgi:hypothetical protein
MTRAGITWKLDVPYLTEVESAVFKRERASGKISPFRARPCSGILNMDSEDKPMTECPNEVPKVDDSNGNALKRYCSKACYVAMENPVEEDDDAEQEW